MLHILSQFLQYNENKRSTSKTSSGGIKIFQKVRYQYHKLNNLQNVQISNKSSVRICKSEMSSSYEG